MPEFYTDVELKFTKDDEPKGLFTGYGAVFGNVDSHGDLIKPGAFKASLAERKAAGRPVPMHVMHKVYGGDGLPVSVWTKIDEDDKGLRVHGKVSGMNTDTGKLLYERAKDGALGGLSIGYRIREHGAIIPKTNEQGVKRFLTDLDLREISLVDSPSNALSRVDGFKRIERFEGPSQIEQIMRDAGAAARAAEKIAAGGWAALNGKLADEDDELENQFEMKRLADVLRANLLDLRRK